MEFHAIYERDGEWWIGYCSEVPGANGQGKTLEECRVNLIEAIKLILKEAVKLYIESFDTEDLPERVGEVILYPLEVAIGD